MKIGTVIVTDIVGYSKLTGDNQELALELLTEHDSIILKSINFFDGKVLVNRGDGFVVIFFDSKNAILCSTDIQTKINRRNKLSVKNRKFKIRIGIHSGPYEIQNGEYHGECIDIASELEPLAPKGGILISSKLNSDIEYIKNIFTREYKKFKINKSNQVTYEVYNNMIDWFSKSSNIFITYNKKYIEKMHYYYNEGDYSASIKFANSIFESTNNRKLKIETSGFLCNAFISAGRIDYANKIIIQIKRDFSKNINNELKGHYLKLEAHVFSNNGKFKKADSLYNESLNILYSIKSKYFNEVLFYLYMNLYLNGNITEQIFSKWDVLLNNDKYKTLIEVFKSVVSKSEIDSTQIKKINNISRIKNKSYGYWLLSQYYSNNKMINESYHYETKAQDLLELCSNNISDIDLKENFKKNILLHKKILSESSVKIDALFDFSNENLHEDSVNSLNSNNFNFCIECGIENVNNVSDCFECKANLRKDVYQ
ncbi:MAG: hypothetical protein CMG50_05105 [Candidatus Marinimicrobia bacterium]|nr:hypothetical protein [Candidatus Neomarinimicrobiota bacterium]